MSVVVEYVGCFLVELAAYEEDVEGRVLRLDPRGAASPLAGIVSPHAG
jgi:hypothetical protein